MSYEIVNNRPTLKDEGEYTVPIREQDSTTISLRAHYIHKILCQNPDHIYLITYVSEIGGAEFVDESIQAAIWDLKSINPTLQYVKLGQNAIMSIPITLIIDVKPIHSLDMGII